MNSSFRDKIQSVLKKKGYRSLRAFYQDHSFAFSYEYLRQILLGEKVPSRKKVAEMASVLGLEEKDLQKTASATKLSAVIQRYYHLPEATRPGRLSEKVRRYREQGRDDRRILAMVGKLGEKEKAQLLDYLNFLRGQWRRRNKKDKKEK